MRRVPVLVGVVLAALTVPGSVAGDGEGGRVELTAPVRRLDTRDPSSPSGGAPVMHVTIGSGALVVSILGATVSGTATIHPCAEPPPVDVTFRLEPTTPADPGIQRARLATADNICLTSTTPVHVVVDDTGTVSAVPAPSGSQFVPLGTAITLYDGPSRSDEPIRIPRPAALAPTATAAVVSLEVVSADGPGYLVGHSCSAPAPLTSDLTYRVNRVANVAYVPLGIGHDLCIAAPFAAAHVRVKLLGELNQNGPNPTLLPPSWRFVPGDVPAPSLRPISPIRVLDTREGVGRPGTHKLAKDDVLELTFGNRIGPQTTAVVLNTTITQPDGPGFLTVWPCGGDRPVVSNLNFVAGETVPNLVVSKLGPGGTICLSASHTTHVVADLNGTFETDGGLHAVPVDPKRILDTRDGTGAPLAKVQGTRTLELQVTDGSLVPADAGAVTLNITATQPDADGYVTAYPCDRDRPQASNVNYVAGQSIPNLVTAKLSSQGTLCLYTSATTHLVADVAAWYGVDRPAGLMDLAPTRILDTRVPIGVPSVGKVERLTFIELHVGGRGGVADDADAVVMNVTVTEPEDAGFVTVWPCDRSMPTVSNVNYLAGEVNPNLATVRLSSTGTVCLYTTARTHLVADVTGYLTDVPVAGVALQLG